jgi:hypothetical protein
MTKYHYNSEYTKYQIATKNPDGQMLLTNPSLSDTKNSQFITKECLKGSAKVFEGFLTHVMGISESVRKNISAYAHILFSHYRVQGAWEKLFFIFIEMGLSMHDTRDDEIYTFIKGLAVIYFYKDSAYHCNLTRGSKKNLIKLLVTKYDNVERFQIKYAIIIQLRFLGYLDSDPENFNLIIGTYKKALYDPKNAIWDEVNQFILEYLQGVTTKLIDSFLEEAHKVVFEKKSDYDEVGRVGLMVMVLLLSRRYDFYGWMEKAANIVLQAKFRNRGIRNKIKKCFSEFWNNRADDVIVRDVEFSTEIKNETKRYCPNHFYFA